MKDLICIPVLQRDLPTDTAGPLLVVWPHNSAFFNYNCIISVTCIHLDCTKTLAALRTTYPWMVKEVQAWLVCVSCS